MEQYCIVKELGGWEGFLRYLQYRLMEYESGNNAGKMKCCDNFQLKILTKLICSHIIFWFSQISIFWWKTVLLESSSYYLIRPHSDIKGAKFLSYEGGNGVVCRCAFWMKNANNTLALTCKISQGKQIFVKQII